MKWFWQKAKSGKNAARPVPQGAEIRDIIFTTIFHRSSGGWVSCRGPMGQPSHIYFARAKEIAARLSNEVPVFITIDDLILWLERQLGGEEFSIWEDAMDGSDP